MPCAARDIKSACIRPDTTPIPQRTIVAISSPFVHRAGPSSLTNKWPELLASVGTLPPRGALSLDAVTKLCPQSQRRAVPGENSPHFGHWSDSPVLGVGTEFVGGSVRRG